MAPVRFNIEGTIYEKFFGKPKNDASKKALKSEGRKTVDPVDQELDIQNQWEPEPATELIQTPDPVFPDPKS